MNFFSAIILILFLNRKSLSNGIYINNLNGMNRMLENNEKYINEFRKTLSDDIDCGETDFTRIVGGTFAGPGEFPWMVGLFITTSGKFCGGTLLSNQYVLTAAHCLESLTPAEIEVRLGEYYFEFYNKNSIEVSNDMYFEVESFKIHKKYKKSTFLNDIAILKLKTKTELNKSIQPICLPKQKSNYEMKSATAAGWGVTSYNGQPSNQLREVNLMIWKNTDCQKAYKNTKFSITDEMLCAGEGDKDSCQGDSGGPLMLKGSNGRWMVIGVVSFGEGCGDKNYPGVYTRVSHYIDWIKVNAGLN